MLGADVMHDKLELGSPPWMECTRRTSPLREKSYSFARETKS